MTPAVILFPSSYFSEKRPDEDLQAEFDAVQNTGLFETRLFSYDKWSHEGRLSITCGDRTPACAIYRGWMMKPEQYAAFYQQLRGKGITLITTPEEYARFHLFPNIYPALGTDTAPMLVFPDGRVDLDAVKAAFPRFMVKDYVKSVKGRTISADCAKKLANALNTDVTELFTLERDMRPLSAKTVREHHALIHMILRQAEQELLVPYTAADKAKPPKVDKTHANYFEQDEITAILEAAEQEPLKWRLLLHLMLVTGGRRGEILGLTWDNVDFVFSKIHIEKCVYYEKEIGIYVDKPKTERSVRYIRLPAETMQLIARYRDEYYEPLKAAAGDKWQGEGSLFVSDTGDKIGRVMHPDSVTGYCDQFAERYGLRHIDPHAFRHTSASILYFAGVDSISISAHLGHAKVSTTFPV
ncbi:MAG: site-specific integrase, partial [Lachnospiraceae bacterium]|nr:site-specific integrase [Lachnospiraceae bacterium]